MASKYLAAFSLWTLLEMTAAQSFFSTNFEYSVIQPYNASNGDQSDLFLQTSQYVPLAQDTPSNSSIQSTLNDFLLQTYPNNPFAQINEYDFTQLQISPAIAMPAFGYDEFSICFYINLKSFLSTTQQVPLLAYTSGDSTEITFHLDYARQASGIYIGNGTRNGVFLPFVPPTNQWTHMCLTWHGNYGLANVYVDGQSTSTSQGIQTGYRIPCDGTWKFDDSLTDVGQVTQLHFWDRVISSIEVQQAQTCSLFGNILAWDMTDMGYQETFTSFYDDFYPCLHQPSTAEEKICHDFPTTSVLDLNDIDPESEAAYVSGYFVKTLHRQTAFTVCAWLYIEELDELGGLPALQVIDEDDVSIFTLQFKKDGSVYIRMGDKEDFDQRYIDSIKMDYYDWQHYCVAWKGLSGNVEFYVNGVLEHSERNFMAGYSLTVRSKLEVRQIQLQNAENDENKPIAGFSFKTMDVNFWDYVLSKDEVTSVYSCSGSLPGNVLSWEKDELYYYNEWPAKGCGVPVTTSFLDSTDYSGSGAQGTVLALAHYPLSVSQGNGLSVCTWLIYLEDTVKQAFLILKNPQNENDLIISLITDNESPYPGFFIMFGKTGLWITGYSLPLNEWHHVCLTWKSSNGEAKLYVDRELAIQKADLNTGGVYTDGGTFIAAQQQTGPTDENNPIKGYANKATDLNFWNYELTEKEVSEAYCSKGYGNVINKDSQWGTPFLTSV